MIILPPLLARSWEEKSLQAGARMKDLMRQAVDGALRELRPFLPKTGTALVLVTHSREAAQICHREISLRDGIIESSLPPGTQVPSQP